MRKNGWQFLASLPLVLVLSACTSTHTSPAMGGGGLIHERNEGYSLLYKILSDDGDVGQIFILKSADEPLKSLVKEIGSAAQTAKKQMDDFAKQDRELEFDVPDLPYIEERGRELQSKVDERQLLFSSGKNFEVLLIYVQAQAMDYATQLCTALAEKEDNPIRRDFLQSLAKQTADFHDRLMKMLTVQ